MFFENDGEIDVVRSELGFLFTIRTVETLKCFRDELQWKGVEAYGYSVTRFGDGEIQVALGADINYQDGVILDKVNGFEFYWMCSRDVLETLRSFIVDTSQKSGTVIIRID